MVLHSVVGRILLKAKTNNRRRIQTFNNVNDLFDNRRLPPSLTLPEINLEYPKGDLIRYVLVNSRPNIGQCRTSPVLGFNFIVDFLTIILLNHESTTKLHSNAVARRMMLNAV